MTRVIAGVARGRRLAVPAGGRTRPTADRTREGLFSTLASLVDLQGCRFADLYAGSGAVGLEALSRGASHVLLVERDDRALRALRANVAAVGLPGTEVRAAAVSTVLGGGPPPAPYDAAFLDPPYDDPVADALAALVPWLADGAVVAVERSSRDAPLVWPEGLEPLRERRYGEALLWYGSRS